MRKLFYFICFALLLSSCSGKIISNSDDPSEAAAIYFNYFVKGKFDSYIQATASYDSIPASYKDRIKALLKQQRKDLKKTKNNIVSFEIEKVECNKDNTKATVFILLRLKSQKEQSIVISLIKQDEKWRLK